MYVKVGSTIPVKRDTGAHNFWLTQAGSGTFGGNFIDTEQLAKEKIQLLAHVRLNQSKQSIQNFKNCLIDSTYTNASDPNSMRDLGMVRNAQYTLGIEKPIYT